jgi:hypothetical protein
MKIRGKCHKILVLKFCSKVSVDFSGDPAVKLCPAPLGAAMRSAQGTSKGHSTSISHRSQQTVNFSNPTKFFLFSFVK